MQWHIRLITAHILSVKQMYAYARIIEVLDVQRRLPSGTCVLESLTAGQGMNSMHISQDSTMSTPQLRRNKVYNEIGRCGL